MRPPTHSRCATRRFVALVVMLLIALLAPPSVGIASAEPEVGSGVVAIDKGNDLGGEPLRPGEEFDYTFSVACTSIEADCVNAVVTDVLPEDLEITSLPQSTSTRTVTYDEATRTLTVLFTRPLQEPAGAFGMTAGGRESFTVGVRLPTETERVSGDAIENTATVDADNAEPEDSATTVTVEVPKVLRPVATKDWADGSAVAGSREQSTMTLGVRNASSNSARVTELAVTDETAATFEHFDYTGAEVTRFPAGADSARFEVLAGGTWQTGGTITAPGALALPAGVTADEVAGLRVVFTNAAGEALPYDATGGSVEVGLTLRETYRSSGEPLRPAERISVDNCAVPSATEAGSAPVVGAQDCARYDILPDVLVLGNSKNFFADANGNFRRDNGEYAVVGENSRVSSVIDIRQNSPFEVREIVISDPGTLPQAEFDKFDVDTVRLRVPAGATEARLVVTYDSGASLEETYEPTPATREIDVASEGRRVTGVTVTYVGLADGDPSIRPNAVAGLDLSGHLNDQVTDADLPGGTSPGVDNCYAFEGTAGRTDGTGTASGTGCVPLPVEAPRSSGSGVKTVGQTSVPPGQPIPFTLRYTNNGNIPLVDATITDGGPTPGPFAALRLVSASVSGAGAPADITLEVYDPDAGSWVAYDGASAALLERATGVRAIKNGELLPTQQFTLSIVTERREGTPDDVVIENCFTPTADGYTSTTPACSPQITTGETSDSGVISKAIGPGSLPRPIPGLPAQQTDVRLTASNSGNLSMSRLTLLDEDADFFDAVSLVDLRDLKFPQGANRVAVDALVDGDWVPGLPLAEAALPFGVTAADVTGVRITFSHDSGENRLVPCANAADCGGAVTLRVQVRETLRSDGETPVPDALDNVVTGSFVTRLQDPAQPREIGPQDATLTLTEGDSQLQVEKTPNSSISPGELAPFRLKVTNSGTSNMTDLRVKDLLPAGLDLNEEFAGDDGQPFRIVDAQVPDGTDPVPTPELTLTRDGERVSGLEFAFGDWVFRPGTTFVIELEVGLRPGVRAGDVVTNTMGATGTGPNFTCGGPSVTDGDFGDGTYCTDTASVTVKAGNAFSARKWVAGNVERGWYNTRSGELLEVGNAQCPSTTDAAGTVYTAFPCVAMVDPGDQYDYLMRVVNAGTESATNMRIVDEFPVEGDRGYGGQNRGTQWDERPRLATAPVLNSGPADADLTVSYTDSADVCTADLLMGGAGSSAPQCAASDWAADFGPDVTAARFDFLFDTPLGPGEGIEIGFSMTTPLNVSQVADPTIAWNSFAHAETMQSGAVMRPIEPIKVGVATAYGALEISKEITDNPYDLAVDELAYPVRAVCTIDPIGGTTTTVVDETVDVTPGTPETIEGIPAGADCLVWEADARGGAASATEDDPVEVTIEPGLGSASVHEITIENSFAPASLTVSKDVTGAAAGYAQPSFEVDLFCAVGGQPVAGFNPLALTVDGNDAVTVDVPPGAECRAVETDTGSATEVTVSDAVDTTTGQSVAIDIENEFRAGGLRIAKELAGPGAPALSDGPFTFDVRCSFDDEDDVFTDTVTLSGDGETTLLQSEVIDGLPVGAECVVTETDSGGADQTPDPVSVVIPDEEDGEAQVVVAGLTNVFSAGTVTVVKELAGDGAEADYATEAEFTVLLRCEREVDGVRTTVFAGDAVLRGGEAVSPLGADGEPLRLPLGTHCFGEETVTGGATDSVVDHDSFENAAVVGEDEELQELVVTATNTFDTAELAVSKELAGGGAEQVGDREFTIAVTCTLDQGGERPTVLLDGEEHRIAGGESVTIEDLPIGAECWAEETETGGAASVEVDGGTIAEPAVVAAAASDGIVVTNTFAAVPSDDLPKAGAPTGLLWMILAGLAALIAGGGLMAQRLRRR